MLAASTLHHPDDAEDALAPKVSRPRCSRYAWVAQPWPSARGCASIGVPGRHHFTAEKKIQSALLPIEDTKSGPIWPRPLAPWQDAHSLPNSGAPLSTDSLSKRVF